VQIAILDDYQNVALTFADWSRVASQADITVFNDHLSEPDDVIDRPQPFDVVCVMRERTPLPREIIERLPRLKMIASIGPPQLFRHFRVGPVRGAREGSRRVRCCLPPHHEPKTVPPNTRVIAVCPPGTHRAHCRCCAA
jgi:hypothetical protein